MSEDRVGGLARQMAGREQRDGFFSRAWRETPIGQLMSGGGLRGAWNATPIMRVINGLRGLGDGPRGTAMNVYGPTTGGYGGAPAPFAPSPVEWGGTNWGEQINPGNPAAAGPWQGAPTLLPGQAGPSNYMGAAQTLGAASGLGGNQAGGLGRLMMSSNPWRQSGTTFGSKPQEF